MRKIYSITSEKEETVFKEKLKEMLWSYHKKPLTFRQKRIIEGIKSKSLAKDDDDLYNE